jgi:hypothetical protein
MNRLRICASGRRCGSRSCSALVSFVCAAMITGCGGASSAHSSPSTGADRSAVGAAVHVSVNPFLARIDSECRESKPALQSVVTNAEHVSTGAASADTSALEMALRSAAALRVSANAIFQAASGAGDFVGKQPLAAANWHANLEFLEASFLYFLHPDTGPTTYQAAAKGVMRQARVVSAYAAEAEMPDCELTVAAAVTSAPGNTTTTVTSPTSARPVAPTVAPPSAESCGASSNEALKSSLEVAADEAHLAGFSKSEGDCLTNIKVDGEWAAAKWPATQPAAMVFRLSGGRWQAVTGGTAIDEGGQEPVPKAVLQGEP